MRQEPPSPFNISRIEMVRTRREDTFCRGVIDKSKTTFRLGEHGLLPSPPHGNAHFASGMNVFQSMCETTPPGLCHHAKVTLTWCGKSANIVENVCRDGPRAFRTTDPGYFGGESYFAVECAYASRYASPKTAGGECPVILFAYWFHLRMRQYVHATSLKIGILASL